MQTKQASFMQCFQQVNPKISNYCRMLTQNETLAEDLLHDTILAAYEKFEQIENDQAFASYLFSIAYNIYSKQLRRKKFKGNYNEKAATFIEALDANAEVKAELSMIMEKMKRLPASQYETLILYHISDLPLKEISMIQQVSLSAVKQRIKRGKENLLKMLNERERKVVMLLL
ncbi:RNA polymerase sigma factor [Roseimarinus sediminis]|uniref:RNA polymerase sigma factor n=1 Tax=Roseimarinus sediminis TaxID=1610899 RepID=UPI003D1CF89B